MILDATTAAGYAGEYSWALQIRIDHKTGLKKLPAPLILQDTISALNLYLILKGTGPNLDPKRDIEGRAVPALKIENGVKKSIGILPVVPRILNGNKGVKYNA